MTKSQLGSDQRQSSANERHRSRSQPTSKRRGDTEDLRYPDVPMKQLQMFFRKGRPIKRDSCPTVKLVRNIHRTLSPSQKLLLIQTRFGSLTDFSRPRISFGKIARHYHMATSSVHKVIKNFILNGYRVLDRRCFNHRSRRVIGSPEFEEFLISKETL